MEKTALSFWDYVKAAFRLKVRVPLLGHLPANKLVLGGFLILGIGHPGFWFLGLAYEAAYLFSLAGNERFQKWIRSANLEKTATVLAQKQNDLFGNLDNASKERYLKARQICSEIYATLPNRDLEDHGLNQLLWIFLKLLNSRIKIASLLDQVDRKALENEIRALEKKVSETPENSPMHRSLSGSLEIQSRRLENLKKAAETLTVTESELGRIENQIRLLMEENSVSGDAEILTVRLDGVMDSLQGTSQWMAQNSELFGALEEDPVLPGGGMIPPPLPEKE